MAKRITAIGLVALAALAVALGGGCGPSTDLTGSPIPNSLPDTRVTARPPELLETGFVVEFFWSGYDPDGRVAGYQWKLSNNGTDGINVQDTLTFDPVTGDTLNPWHTIVSTDSTFLVTADIPDFPRDPEGSGRSYQTHTFFVRAIDEDGGVDDSPALVSFTSTTLLPTIQITGPSSIPLQTETVQLPPTVTFLFEGTDPDFTTGIPTQMRYLWKPALLPNGDYAGTETDVENNIDFLVDFEDSLWTPWRRYDPDDETRRVTLADRARLDAEGERIFYIFAMQARDTAGAVSIGRRYARQIANVAISVSLAPRLRVLETFLGEVRGSGPNVTLSTDVAAGQELNFSWSADASGYAGEIVSFRYGWDVTDVNDPNDPNWALPPGNSSQHRRAQPIAFSSGVHTLTVEVRDNSDQLSRASITVSVVPVPDPADQLPLLLVDDVLDGNSFSWPDQSGIPRDRDAYRDDFWRGVLGGPGGVAGWDSLAHTVDSEEQQLDYREVVRYRALVWSSRWASQSTYIASQFRPSGGNQDVGDQDQYIWLTPYQESVGNVLLTGNRVMNNFLAQSAFELPIVFQSREGNRLTGYETVRDTPVRRSFGYRALPNGDEIQVGPTRYPYQTMGVSVIDVMSPNAAYYEYGNGRLVNRQRRKACVGMKGLQIDAGFKANYMPGGDVFADVIWTEDDIDWADEPFPEESDVLAHTYTWGDDEFYNADVVSRNTPWDPQSSPEFDCDGDCLEPMFRSISRFDWARMQRLEIDPEDTWPIGYYNGPGQPVLSNLCGDRSLDVGQQSAITNDQVVAFIARKTAPNKPSQVGDVVFGFDPYRFDQDEMRDAIRWVLGEHFGLSMTSGGK